jgi:hypothetical protein
MPEPVRRAESYGPVRCTRASFQRDTRASHTRHAHHTNNRREARGHRGPSPEDRPKNAPAGQQLHLCVGRAQGRSGHPPQSFPAGHPTRVTQREQTGTHPPR